MDGERVWNAKRPRASVTLSFCFFPDSVSPSVPQSCPYLRVPQVAFSGLLGKVSLLRQWPRALQRF